MLRNLIKTGLDVASLPVAVVKDVVTLNERDETANKVEDICEDIDSLCEDIFGA